MKNLIQIFLVFLSIVSTCHLQAQCTDCSVMVCDGVSCEDGTNGDGVQTSRKCGCGTEISGACAIVDIDLTLSPYYDPYDPACGLILTSQESGNFSIYFIEEGCEFADCQNPDFVISSDQRITSLPDAPTFSMMVCKNGGNAGRRDFNFSISCSTIENCTNQVDDDNNGFIDCDDPGCGTACAYSETTSSADGGLESNNRLAAKIATRNYERSLSAPKNYSEVDRLFPADFQGSRNSNYRNDLSLSDVTPWDAIPEGIIYETTPIDLLSLTNAIDIFAFDIYQNQSRIASVLATETLQNVYEHTKYICDRLGGSTIDQVWNYNFGTSYSFIVTKFTDADGRVEYNCNFSIIEQNLGQWNIESHWDLDTYTKGFRTMNFQLWANNTLNLGLLVQRFIENLESSVHIAKSNMSGTPLVIASNVKYENGKIKLNLINKSQVSSIRIEGKMRRTEFDVEYDWERDIILTGSPTESIEIDDNGFYDLIFKIDDKKENGVNDVVYLADGSWGMDNTKAAAVIHQFEINAFDGLTKLGRHVERDIKIQGRIKNNMSIFRTLTPHNRGVNLDQYDQIEFKAFGEGNVEVVLIHADIQEWEKHPRITIGLNNEESHIILDKASFAASSDVKWDKIKMIIFHFKGNGTNYESFSMELSELRFTTSDEKQGLENKTRVEVYPNPAQQEINITFLSENNASYTFQLWSTDGKLEMERKGVSTKGFNQLVVNRSGIRDGMYLMRLISPQKLIYSGNVAFH